MYQALYRKYRPKKFSEIIGQDVIVKTLKNSIKTNMINHAYLFCGPRGTGKTSMAKIFANTINCENIIDGEKCNKCVFCTQNKNDDIIEIDAASNNGVDEIRELKNNVNLVPSIGKYKVYIIDEVHMLTVGAFNALLKTLEEPPSHVIFILATTEPHKIPLTILSRCQRFDFKKISKKIICNRLMEIASKENINIEIEAANEISIICDGGMRDAISMLDQAHSYENEKISLNVINDITGNISDLEIKNLINCIIKKDLNDSYKIIDQCIIEGKNIIRITEKLLLNFRNILLYKNAPDYFKDKQVDINLLENISQEINNEGFLKIITIINDKLSLMKKNENPNLILELMFIELLKYNDQKSNVIVEEKNIIKNEIKEEKLSNDIFENNKKENDEELQNINPNVKTEINKLKNIRVNNTLAHFDKKILLKIKKDLELVRSLVLDPEHSKAASIVLDGDLKAASSNYLIYVFNTQNMSDIFNNDLPIIENMIKSLLNIDYKCISVSNDEWQIIKKEFNSHQKEYNFIDELNLFSKIYSKNSEDEKDDIEKIFGNIIEYK
ncbi:MAG: DNA polymerase III subunit gamma/tau [Bacilli bacterium]